MIRGIRGFRERNPIPFILSIHVSQPRRTAPGFSFSTAWAGGSSAQKYCLLSIRAGEPAQSRIRQPSVMVYPRVCGGTFQLRNPPLVGSGLSPRVRGNPVIRQRLTVGPRSIPACAGEPRTSSSAASISRVYPRVCGGTKQPSLFSRAINGLSPRVRGNLGSDDDITLTLGSIPACAGEPPLRLP